MAITHKFVSGKTDGGDATLVRPSSWNDVHSRDYTVTATSANLTLTSAHEMVLATAGAGGITITLPTAVGIAGRWYYIKKVDSAVGLVTIATTSSQTIDGATGRTLTGQYQDIILSSDGANWVELDEFTAGFYYDKTNARLYLTDANPEIQLANSSTDPGPPSAGNLLVYSRSMAARSILKTANPDGSVDYCQPAFFKNSIMLFGPSSSTSNGSSLNFSLGSATGTVSHPVPATGSVQSCMRRIRYASSTTAGSGAGCRSAQNMVWRGNAAGLGGFFYYCRFSQSANVNGGRAFVGINGLGPGVAFTTDPTTIVNSMGMGYNAGDASTGNWFLIFTDATPTANKIDLGTSAARNTTDVYELFLYCPPNSTGVTARVYNLSTATVVLDNTTYTTNLPGTTSFMTTHWEQHNGAVAAAVQIELGQLYVETSF